jgi:DNA invertase Pin-like site-specific DNA recombinase
MNKIAAIYARVSSDRQKEQNTNRALTLIALTCTAGSANNHLQASILTAAVNK